MLRLIAAGVLAGGYAALCTAAAPAWSNAAYCVNDPREPWPWQEGNDDINRAKSDHALAGATVYAYLRNPSPGPASVSALRWNGVPIDELLDARRAVWWRALPAEAPAGGFVEVALRLRKTLDAPGTLDVAFSTGAKETVEVAPDGPAFRIESTAFSPDRHKMFLYIEQYAQDAPLPETVLMDAPDTPARVRWLGKGYAGGLCVGVVELPEPLAEGALHTWVARGGGAAAGAALRTIARPAVFGTFGAADYARQAQNGLTSFYSFGALDTASLDAAHALGIRPAFYIGAGNPPEGTRGHPALYGYCLKDEPDCHDFSAGKDLPMGERIGTLAPAMVDEAARCFAADPATPVLLTLDLTFTPANYYVYGPIADITTPDCYPVTVGESLEFLRDCATHAKRATAPRPFGFIYQGCWEEFGIPQGRYVGRAELLEKGFDAFTDPERVRGLGRPPVPAEIRIQIAYAVGCGARALWSFIDSSEAGGSLVFHGSTELPEVWAAIGDMSRALRRVEGELNLAHPIAWATTSCPEALWVRTLICGEDAALVVVVNEGYRCDKEGFFPEPAEDVAFTFPPLPWLKAGRVERITAGGVESIKAVDGPDGLVWRAEKLEDVALFRLSR